MLVKAKASRIKGVGWSQYAIRFALGGAITSIAGMLANKFGPAVGGLFLAFPAIFPASVMLIEKTEKAKKRSKGMHGDDRGREAAALDAYGAALGSIALMPFAVLCWLLLPKIVFPAVLITATAVWAAGSVGLWAALRWRRHSKRRAVSRNRAAGQHATTIQRS